MLKNLSLRTGLLSLLAVMTFLMLLVSGFAIYALQQGASSLQRIHHLQSEQAARLDMGYTTLLRARDEAGVAVRQMETGLLDDAAASTKRVTAQINSAEVILKEQLAENVDDAQGAQLLKQLSDSFAQYDSKGIQPMLAALNQQSPDKYYELQQNTLLPLSRDFDNQMQHFQHWAGQRGADEVTAVQFRKNGVLVVIVVAMLVSIGLMALVWLILRHLLLNPLNAAIMQLEMVASGDLTSAVHEHRNNELGRLSIAIEKMRISLVESVTRVREASSHIDVGSRELTLGNADLAQRTESTASSLEETAASMEQITATVKQNADNAQQAHQMTRHVSDTADHGSEMVCYVIEKMRDIATSSGRIADILGVIDGIAFQTNILALNASVEAARAGEQGRGFAVVASEVRNLAQRSADAAKEIRTLITASQSHVDEGQELAQQAGETIDEIATEVLRMTKLMREIANASQEQSNGIEQVNIAVSKMDESAQQNAALVQESAAAMQSMEQQSRLLVESMEVFKLTGGSVPTQEALALPA